MNSRMFKLSLVLILLAVPKVALAESLVVASIFTDHAVIQRDMDVPVWGQAVPSAQVAISFAGQKKNTKADADGRWQVSLDAMQASSNPREMTISSGSESLVLEDLLVGEVWIAAGQSNMNWGIDRVPEVKALVPLAKNIRHIRLPSIASLDEQTTINSHWITEPPQSAVALSFSYHLEQISEVPVGIIQSAFGGSKIEAWMPRTMAEDLRYFGDSLRDFDADTGTLSMVEAVIYDSVTNGNADITPHNPPRVQHKPTLLYNAMMHSLIPYAARGIAWYQGEANSTSVDEMQAYGGVLNAWIGEYRSRWNREDLHFLIVGLPGFGKVLETSIEKGTAHPQAHSWAWLREAQTKVLQLPHTSLINTIDLGEVDNIHPQDKLPVGERLALMAARDTLGYDLGAQGPVMQEIQKNGNKLIVSFDYAENLKTTDGQSPKGFWIASEEGVWVKATATINGQQVSLSSEQIVNPKYVRYAFSAKPEVNLINEFGLPAQPFRTDLFIP